MRREERGVQDREGGDKTEAHSYRMNRPHLRQPCLATWMGRCIGLS